MSSLRIMHVLVLFEIIDGQQVKMINSPLTSLIKILEKEMVAAGTMIVCK